MLGEAKEEGRRPLLSGVQFYRRSYQGNRNKVKGTGGVDKFAQQLQNMIDSVKMR